MKILIKLLKSFLLTLLAFAIGALFIGIFAFLLTNGYLIGALAYIICTAILIVTFAFYLEM